MITFTKEHLMALLDVGFSVKEIQYSLGFDIDLIEHILECDPGSYILLRKDRYDRYDRR